MLPGKKYKPEDILRILRKRIWLLLVPFAVISAATAVVARKLPNRFRSDTLILVVPQRVPEGYVKSTVTSPLEERLQSIYQQITSRTRLERIIDQFNLYAEERRTGIMEDIVEKMKRDIFVNVKRGDAFSVTYWGSDPRTVRRVTEQLATNFIDESMRDRENLAEGTNQFLEGTLEDARRQLQDKERKVKEYREKYAGELPTQQESNLQAMANVQLQIQSVVQSLHDAQNRRLLLDKQLSDLENPSEPPVPEPAVAEPQRGPDGTPVNATAAQLLDYWRMVREEMVQVRKLGPGHPDLKAVQRTIADLERRRLAESLAQPVSTAVTRSIAPAEQQRLKRIEVLRNELTELDAQIAYNKGEEKRLRGVVVQYQRKIDAVPTRESEWVELTRDYEALQSMYNSMLQKKEDSKVAANLERRQIGETFKVLDPASLPERPSSPNRPQINMFGMIAGLAVGIALVGLLEYRDASFKTDEEVVGVLTLPVLAVVPLMQSEEDRRRALRRRLIVGFGLGSTVLGCLAVLAYTFVR